jgi:hypothetical protein
MIYLVIVWCLLFTFGKGPMLGECLRHVYVAAAAIVLGCYVSRGTTVLPLSVRKLAYRLALTGVIVQNYLMLRDVLPALRPDNVDASLLAVDLSIFRVEPAIWLERFNRIQVVEWFALF